MRLIDSRLRYNRTEEQSYNLLITGVPNVGKSSLINAMRNVHTRKSGKATRVGATAGVTRSVLEKIKVSDSPKIYVFDTPGILQPKPNNMNAAMKLALCGTLQDHILGSETIVDFMLYWLNKNGLFDYVEYFQLPSPTDNVIEFLSTIATKKNMMIKIKSVATGKYEIKPNFQNVSQMVLKAFRDGNLGKMNLDRDLLLNVQSNELF